MKDIKPNQFAIITFAMVLIIVGYLNYGVDTNNEKNDNEYALVSANVVNEVGLGDAKLVNAESSVEYVNALVENSNASEDDYFTNSRIERESMYSQMIETYNNMLESTSITNEQKAIASNEITKINETKNAIMIAENLIKTKGFEDVVIFENNGSINVVVKTAELNTEDISKLQNIISREMNAEIGNIHISNK